MKPAQTAAVEKTVHVPTVISVGAIAYILATMLHEGVGHGGACVLVGGHPIAVSTVYMECSSDHWLVLAGGTLMNVAAGVLSLALGRIGSLSPPWRYFFWIFMTVNLLMAAGYFAFSGIGGIGDWAMLIQGLNPQWLWRAGMALFGVAAYLLVVRLSLHELARLIGAGGAERQVRAVRLMRPPYFAGGILACIAGAFNPKGMILVAISAAASTFGGTSALAWMDNWLRRFDIPPVEGAAPLTIPRSLPWIIVAGIASILFVIVLGPGLSF